MSKLSVLKSLFSLRFEPQQEKLFQAYYRINYIGYRRAVLFVALLVIAIISPFDFYVFEGVVSDLITIRYGVGLFVIAVAAVLTFSPLFERIQQSLISVVVIFFGFILTAMLSIAPEKTISLYQPGYLMAIFFVGAMARQSFLRALIATVLIILSDNVLLLFIRPQSWEVIANYNIYLFDTALMALFTNYVMERAIRNEFATIYHIQNERDILSESNHALQHLACTDGLTGLFNRRHMEEVFEKEWSRASRDKTPLSVLMVDVDHFKYYNDRYGHLQGDECLKIVANCLANTFRRGADVVARYGGEEFVVLLPGIDRSESLLLAQNLCQELLALEIPHEASLTTDFVSLSAGVASLVPTNDVHYATLIKQADNALYRCKENGRNQACLYEEKIN